MAELTPEEKKVLEKMKEAVRTTPMAEPPADGEVRSDKFDFPIGIDDQGKPFPLPEEEKEGSN